MKATTFFDMSSGGGNKEDFELLVIEAPLDEAVSVFYSRYGHNPYRITCTCCGSDYSITEYDSLEDAEKNLIAQYHRRENTLIISAGEIEDYERQADLPQQGYIWV